MMKDLFLQTLNMSISASWIVAVIAIVRLVFKKVPKSIVCFLWLFVAVRLILPFSFESSFSLVPKVPQIKESTIVSFQQQIIPTSSSANAQIVISSVQEDFLADGMKEAEKDFSVELTDVLLLLWLSGVGAMLTYMLYSTHKIRKQAAASIVLKENIWVCDDLPSPFILGVLKPKIYLPSYLNEQEMSHVLAHEKAHLKRFDHWWKPLGYLLLSVHWFNPVMWIAYGSLCSDIEMACDEKVIKTLGEQYKVEYSKTLLSHSVPRKMIVSCPLAFGEVSVKQRIKSVLSYKKPAFWVLLMSLMLVMSIPFFFLGDPLSDETIIEKNTVYFIESLGGFAQRYTENLNEYTELYTKRKNEMPKGVSVEESQQLAEEIYKEVFRSLEMDINRAYLSFMNDEQIETLYMNRMFSWPFIEEYVTEFKEVKAYENSYSSVGYAVFDDFQWRFDFSWINEDGKLKMSGFSMKKLELEKEEIVTDVFEVKGTILNSMKSEGKIWISVLSASESLPWMVVEDSLLKDLAVGDSFKINYRKMINEETREEEFHVLSFEELDVKKNVMEIVHMQYMDDKTEVYFSHENPNNNISVEVNTSMLRGFELGTVVEVVYEIYRKDALDNKSYDVYEVISFRKAGGYYEEGTLFSEYILERPVKVQIERVAYRIGDPNEVVVLEDVRDIAAFVQKMDEIKVYKDYIVEPGAGGQIYILKLTLEDGRTIQVETYDDVDVLYSTPTAFGFSELNLGFHFAKENQKTYASILETYFQAE